MARNNIDPGGSADRIDKAKGVRRPSAEESKTGRTGQESASSRESSSGMGVWPKPTPVRTRQDTPPRPATGGGQEDTPTAAPEGGEPAPKSSARLDLDSTWPHPRSSPPSPGSSTPSQVEIGAEAGRRRPDPLSAVEQVRLRDPLIKAALPKGIYAHFLLVDIDSPAGRARGLPRYLKLETRTTVIGRALGARILLDDSKTVQLKHASIVFHEWDGGSEFVLRPIAKSRVRLNGDKVPPEGATCRSGDTVEIGSARLIFFMKDMNPQDRTAEDSRGLR